MFAGLLTTNLSCNFHMNELILHKTKTVALKMRAMAGRRAFLMHRNSNFDQRRKSVQGTVESVSKRASRRCVTRHRGVYRNMCFGDLKICAPAGVPSFLALMHRSSRHPQNRRRTRWTKSPVTRQRKGSEDRSRPAAASQSRRELS